MWIALYKLGYGIHNSTHSTYNHFYFFSFFLQVVPASQIPDGWMGLDIGPDSIKTFSVSLDSTKTVIWNGPMGVFEFDKFAVGTEV